MNERVRTRVYELAADVFAEPPDSVGAESAPSNLESWDSLAHLNLMMALEDEFAIQLAPEDIESMNNLGAIADLVASRLP